MPAATYLLPATCKVELQKDMQPDAACNAMQLVQHDSTAQ